MNASSSQVVFISANDSRSRPEILLAKRTPNRTAEPRSVGSRSVLYFRDWLADATFGAVPPAVWKDARRSARSRQFTHRRNPEIVTDSAPIADHGVWLCIPSCNHPRLSPG
jgi:hypothetical protein